MDGGNIEKERENMYMAHGRKSNLVEFQILPVESPIGVSSRKSNLRLSSSPFCLRYYMRTEWLFYQNVGLTKEKSLVFQISLCIVWIHNDSMYVRFGGIRNTKTWRKSSPI